MFNKLCGLGIIAALFIVVGEAKSQSGLPTDPTAIEALYMNLSLRQLGVPNPLNDPFFFSSPNAPAGYLGLCSLTNTDAVMQNLDVILQHTQINTGGSTFDPVFGMRYTNGTVANAYTNANAAQTLSAPTNIPTLETINATSDTVIQAGTLSLNSGALSFGGTLTIAPHELVKTYETGLIKMGEGSLTLTGQNTYMGSTTISSGTLNISGGSAGTVYTGGIFESSIIAKNLTNLNVSELNSSIFLSGNNNSIVSANTNAGTLQIEGGNTVQVSSGTVSLNGGTTLSTNPWGTSTLNGLAGTLTIAGNGGTDRGITLAHNPNSGTLVIGDSPLQLNSQIDVSGNSELMVTPIVSGTGLVKIGTGALTLNGNLNYQDPATLNEGAVSFDNAGLSSTVITDGGATLSANPLGADALTIDPSPFASPGTVILARNGSFILNPDGVAIAASVVPEPGILLLLMSGLSFFFLTRRSRRAM